MADNREPFDVVAELLPKAPTAGALAETYTLLGEEDLRWCLPELAKNPCTPAEAAANRSLADSVRAEPNEPLPSLLSTAAAGLFKKGEWCV